MEINVFSDVLLKYEDYLIEKNLILIDAEIKNENNQTSRIIAKRICLLNDYISNNKYNVTLFTNSNKHLDKLVPLLGILEVGYSDHTPDVITPALSVIAGATYIEKHFTYNKNQKLGDHKFSLNPGELRIMMKNVRLAESSKGKERKTISPKEKKLQFFMI